MNPPVSEFGMFSEWLLIWWQLSMSVDARPPHLHLSNTSLPMRPRCAGTAEQTGFILNVTLQIEVLLFKVTMLVYEVQRRTRGHVNKDWIKNLCTRKKNNHLTQYLLLIIWCKKRWSISFYLWIFKLTYNFTRCSASLGFNTYCRFILIKQPFSHKITTLSSWCCTFLFELQHYS